MNFWVFFFFIFINNSIFFKILQKKNDTIADLTSQNKRLLDEFGDGLDLNDFREKVVEYGKKGFFRGFESISLIRHKLAGKDKYLATLNIKTPSMRHAINAEGRTKGEAISRLLKSKK